MASDPYGFQLGKNGPPPDAELPRALWFGIGSLGAAAVGPCLCYVPFLAAIPLGLLAVRDARRFSNSAEPLERTVSTAAVTAGGIGAGISVLGILLAIGYLIFFGMMGLTNMLP